MPKSTASSTTVQTVEDALDRLSIIEETRGELSFDAATAAVTLMCGTNKKLAADTIKSLQSPVAYFSVVFGNARGLVSSMFKCNAVLGNVQATAMFFPITTVLDAPWDFHCSTLDGNPDRFVNDISQIGMFETVEDIKSTTGERTVQLRGNIQGSKEPVNVRVFVSRMPVMESILSFKYSYQQSFVSAVGAICYWPKLLGASQCRSFADNPGLGAYPTGKSRPVTRVKSLSLVRPRSNASNPSIFTAQDKRIKCILFDNEVGVDSGAFARAVERLRSPVYSVHNKSTRYLGDLGGMS